MSPHQFYYPMPIPVVYFFIYLVSCEAQKTLTYDSDKQAVHKDRELLESGVTITILRL